MVSDDNSWETPDALYASICTKVRILPKLDVCASIETSKCPHFFTEEQNALGMDWLWDGDVVPVWMNPPNIHHVGKNDGLKAFVEKAHEQWRKHNMQIVAILPASAFATKYFVKCAWQYPRNIVEVNPILPRPSFLLDGKQSEFGSRNSYMSVIWHKFNFKSLATDY